MRQKGSGLTKLNPTSLSSRRPESDAARPSREACEPGGGSPSGHRAAAAAGDCQWVGPARPGLRQGSARASPGMTPGRAPGQPKALVRCRCLPRDGNHDSDSHDSDSDSSYSDPEPGWPMHP
jgi:hypothetical protein